MYTLDETQIDSAESFINSLPDSIVKGNYERWLAAVNDDGRITSEQLEKFVSFANALPPEFQNFPQNFVHSVKNKVAPENQSEGSTEESKNKKAAKKSASKNKPSSTPQKSSSQAKQEEDIIKRNKQVDEKPKVEKHKPTTVIVEKKSHR